VCGGDSDQNVFCVCVTLGIRCVGITSHSTNYQHIPSLAHTDDLFEML